MNVADAHENFYRKKYGDRIILTNRIFYFPLDFQNYEA